MPERRVRKRIEVGEKTDLQAADTDRNGRRDDLYDKFELCTECENIVEDAERYNNRRTEQYAQHGLVQLTEYQNGAKEAAENRKAAKTRNRFLVHAAVILWYIDRTNLVREPFDGRRKEVGQHAGQDEGGDDYADYSIFIHCAFLFNAFDLNIRNISSYLF